MIVRAIGGAAPMHSKVACGLILCAVALTVALAPALAITPALASSPTLAAGAPSKQDREATHAYLLAVYSYEQETLANLSASVASAEGLSATLGGECPGVLAGAPPGLFGPSGFLEGKGGPQPQQTARQQGEASRRQRQLNVLENELSSSLSLAFEQPDRGAALTLANTVAGLSWSDPKLTQLARQATSERAQAVTMAPPAVCADLRAWVASGYKTLSPGTKQSANALRSDDGILLAKLQGLLVPYEGPSEKAILAQTRKVARTKEDGDIGKLLHLLEHLPHTLGFPPNIFEEAARWQTHKHPPVPIAHGRTAAGESYKVSVESPEKLGAGAGRGCSINIETSAATRISGLRGVTISSGGGDCRNSGWLPEAGVQCNNGLLTIDSNTLTRARRVILRLSNGRQIGSPVAIVPKRLGGPAGIYYQVVRGPSPIPVSLTELNAHGHKLRTVALPRVVECTRPAVRYLPDGLRTIVHDSVPGQGPAFSIIAQHYRFLGHTYFAFKLEVQPLPGEEAGGFADGGEIILHSDTTGHKPSPYSWQYRAGLPAPLLRDHLRPAEGPRCHRARAHRGHPAGAARRADSGEHARARRARLRGAADAARRSDRALGEGQDALCRKARCDGRPRTHRNVRRRSGRGKRIAAVLAAKAA